MRLRLKLTLFVLCAAGAGVLFLAGCEKAAEEKKPAAPASAEASAVPSNAPASYMNDPVFREAVASKRKELQAIAAKRRPLADRMQALVNRHGEDLAKLQKIPEWNDLHKQVEALTAQYEKLRREQLRLVRERLAPAGGTNGKKISK